MDGMNNPPILLFEDQSSSELSKGMTPKMKAIVARTYIPGTVAPYTVDTNPKYNNAYINNGATRKSFAHEMERSNNNRVAFSGDEYNNVPISL
jgi:hypothetical protein